MESLKKKLKKIIPPQFICLYKESKYLGTIKKYRTGMKNIQAKQKSRKLPKVVFVIQFPEVWNSIYTVYQAFEAIGADPLILCVPKPAVNFSGDYKESPQNEAYQFFGQLGIPAIDGYDAKSQSWFDLKAAQPDYVFYTRPYNRQYPVPYKSSCVCGYAKVCYIPYAYSQTVDGLSYVTFNYEFILTAYLTFVPSKIRLKECKERFVVQDLLHTHKFVYRGFPRFDLLKSRLADAGQAHSGRKTVLWLPRWTVDALKGQRHSSFFKYLDHFLGYMEKHPEYELIIRPHPLMFQVILEKNFLTQAELDQLTDNIEKTPNIHFDENKDYLDSFGKSDILVADYSSLLIEYFVSGKPVIYCDTADDFNQDALLMDSALYHAAEWHDVEVQLTRLLNGEDCQLEKRKNAIRQLMPSNAGQIGKEIAEFVLADFK